MPESYIDLEERISEVHAISLYIVMDHPGRGRDIIYGISGVKSSFKIIDNRGKIKWPEQATSPDVPRFSRLFYYTH